MNIILSGSVSALFNILLMLILVGELNFNTFFLINISNLISIEISLIISFFIYRYFVWSHTKDEVSNNFNIFPVLLRILFVFPLLDLLGVHYLINTIIGIFLSFLFNILLSDDFLSIYKNNGKSKKYFPEIFERGLYKKNLNIQQNINSTKSKTDTNNFKLSIIVPAYNEETNIGSTITSLLNTLNKNNINFEILVVNDNSTDSTEEILKNISSTEVKYINSYYPNGYGYAVRCGLESFRGEAVTIFMADKSDSPDDVVKYYHELINGFDCVFGSRFLAESELIDYPIHKLILNRMANMFIQIIFGIKYNDTTNAFKAYRREVIDGISPLISHHFNLTVEMPLKAISRGYNYAVVPIRWENRTSGLSKLKIQEMGSRYLFIVLSIFLEKILSRGDYNRTS
jgi:dolichol-phosphate mannosyltransferase